MIYYYQDRTEIQRIYYDFYHKFGRNAKMLAFITGKRLEYFKRYILVNEFHKRLHPFQFLKEGDHVIHVGFHNQYIDLGVSHPLIISAIVGPQGHVWAIDPDEKNTSALRHFIKTNNIENITVINKGIWKEKGKLNFLFFRDFTSSNTAVPVVNNIQEGLQRRWGSKRIKEQSYIKTVDVDTLDSIVASLPTSQVVNFINLTVNGAESAIIEGASKTLNGNPDIVLAFPVANVSASTCDYLGSLGYSIVVADAPHRPWEREQFLYGCAVKHSHQALISMGFRKVNLKTVSALSDDGVGRFAIEEM